MIKTTSFELGIYEKGAENTEKLALVLPGFLDTKDYPHMRELVDMLAASGFHALSFDPPGTWESSGEIALYTMSNYLQAIDELVAYFGNPPTFAVGHSRGGSMAMIAGVRNPHITVFASIMSFYSFDASSPGPHTNSAWKETGFRESKRDIPGSPDFKQFRLPYSHYLDSLQYNVLEDLKSCTKPKLFVYGSRDTTVNPEIVQTAYEAAASPKELHSIESDHDYRHDTESIREVNNIVTSFANRYFV
ncbi:alpha/beta hydrolase [Candidatus Roizmanbacteria bacterium]|nr:alpha/beta hydrolase [Candidatus Roizmanbacteria bacterium]